jgi:hypothetical protein
VAVPLFLLLACEADLAMGAVAIGLSLRSSRVAITVVLTGALSIAFVVALFVLWAMWFVAPGCIVSSDCAVPGSSYANLAAGAAAQWAWMLAIALGARFAKKRTLAHVSG